MMSCLGHEGCQNPSPGGGDPTVSAEVLFIIVLVNVSSKTPLLQKLLEWYTQILLSLK